MSVFTGFNQPVAEAAKKNDEPALIVSESFLVIARSSCGCSVTACGDLESGCRRVIPVRKCNGSHDAKLVELTIIAKKRLEFLIEDVSGGKRLRGAAIAQTLERV